MEDRPKKPNGPPPPKAAIDYDTVPTKQQYVDKHRKPRVRYAFVEGLMPNGRSIRCRREKFERKMLDNVFRKRYKSDKNMELHGVDTGFPRWVSTSYTHEGSERTLNFFFKSETALAYYPKAWNIEKKAELSSFIRGLLEVPDQIVTKELQQKEAEFLTKVTKAAKRARAAALEGGQCTLADVAELEDQLITEAAHTTRDIMGLAHESSFSAGTYDMSVVKFLISDEDFDEEEMEWEFFCAEDDEDFRAWASRDMLSAQDDMEPVGASVYNAGPTALLFRNIASKSSVGDGSDVDALLCDTDDSFNILSSTGGVSRQSYNTGGRLHVSAGGTPARAEADKSDIELILAESMNGGGNGQTLLASSSSSSGGAPKAVVIGSTSTTSRLSDGPRAAGTGVFLSQDGVAEVPGSAIQSRFASKTGVDATHGRTGFGSGSVPPGYAGPDTGDEKLKQGSVLPRKTIEGEDEVSKALRRHLEILDARLEEKDSKVSDLVRKLEKSLVENSKVHGIPQCAPLMDVLERCGDRLVDIDGDQYRPMLKTIGRMKNVNIPLEILKVSKHVEVGGVYKSLDDIPLHENKTKAIFLSSSGMHVTIKDEWVTSFPKLGEDETFWRKERDDFGRWLHNIADEARIMDRDTLHMIGWRVVEKIIKQKKYPRSHWIRKWTTMSDDGTLRSSERFEQGFNAAVALYASAQHVDGEREGGEHRVLQRTSTTYCEILWEQCGRKNADTQYLDLKSKLHELWRARLRVDTAVGRAYRLITDEKKLLEDCFIHAWPQFLEVYDACYQHLIAPFMQHHLPLLQSLATWYAMGAIIHKMRGNRSPIQPIAGFSIQHRLDDYICIPISQKRVLTEADHHEMRITNIEKKADGVRSRTNPQPPRSVSGVTSSGTARPGPAVATRFGSLVVDVTEPARLRAGSIDMSEGGETVCGTPFDDDELNDGTMFSGATDDQTIPANRVKTKFPDKIYDYKTYTQEYGVNGEFYVRSTRSSAEGFGGGKYATVIYRPLGVVTEPPSHNDPTKMCVFWLLQQLSDKVPEVTPEQREVFKEGCPGGGFCNYGHNRFEQTEFDAIGGVICRECPELVAPAHYRKLLDLKLLEQCSKGPGAMRDKSNEEIWEVARASEKAVVEEDKGTKCKIFAEDGAMMPGISKTTLCIPISSRFLSPGQGKPRPVLDGMEVTSEENKVINRIRNVLLKLGSVGPMSKPGFRVPSSTTSG